ncbi:MAG: PBECR2 nuclease fold domain-containing protein [Eubacteriales bacterium]|nr:PBECR2 nuclease fold domain-containing protein [Eubacteriales bacterium]
MIKIASSTENKKTTYLVGEFSEKIIKLLSLNIEEGTQIFISDSNVEHIRDHHPDVYIKYFDLIEDILQNPDYVGIAGVQQASIEYIKTLEIHKEYINVAVRATKSGVYFVRSMFIISDGKLTDYLKKRKIKRYKTSEM